MPLMPEISPRESDVISLLPTDMTYAEIGKKLGIKKGSVMAHIGRLLKKFGVDSRWQLTREVFPEYGVRCYEEHSEISIGSGYWVLVDNIDFDKVVWFKWSPIQKRGKYYAHRQSGSGLSIYLHRFILNAPDGEKVDHKNGNGLDCRRNNMRLCSNAENLRNRGLQKNNKSGYKGVCWVRSRGKWFAQIKVNRKTIGLGEYDDIELAAQAYRDAAVKYHGEFAHF